ncbi:hypothetical protein EVAR_52721_1 [Eumeta japonica]|uniref:Mariner Mos1 transposase n=1 Tax=Eumeta variegata TaxID=151549 RepID=A0A4C1ZIE6_EUMVA|nr:hypothetical protein EVAR_52721_1 [Eumeta japonica]
MSRRGAASRLTAPRPAASARRSRIPAAARWWTLRVLLHVLGFPRLQREASSGSEIEGTSMMIDMLPNVYLNFSLCLEQAAEPGLRRPLLHHDEAPAHSALEARGFVDSTPVRLVDRPGDSFDLTPCHFLLCSLK